MNMTPGKEFQSAPETPDAEQKKNGCRKFLTSKAGKWTLTPDALQHLDLLTQ